MSSRKKFSIFSNTDSDESLCSPSANVSSFSANTSHTSEDDPPIGAGSSSTHALHHNLSAQISNLAIRNAAVHDESIQYVDRTSSNEESTVTRTHQSNESNQQPLRRSTRLRSTSSQPPNTPDLCSRPKSVQHTQAELAANKAQDIADLLRTLEGSSSNEAATSSSSSHPKTSDAQRGGSIASTSSTTEQDLTPLGDNLRVRIQRHDCSGETPTTTPIKHNRKPARVAVLLSRLSIDKTVTPVHSDQDSSSSADDDDNAKSPSPRKLRVRTPSAKCLESFQLTPPRNSPTPPPPLRMSRRSASSKKYTEYIGGLQKRNERSSRSKDNERNVGNEEMECDGADEDALKKSSMLYDQTAGDVAGKQMFSFRTPKKRDGMALLAASAAPKTPTTVTPKRKSRPPKTPITPKSQSRTVANTLPTKTPSRFRTRMKKGKNHSLILEFRNQKCKINSNFIFINFTELTKMVKNVETSGSDFSADESDEYQPDVAGESSDARTSEDDDDDDHSNSDNENHRTTKYVPPTVKAAPKTPSRLTRSSARRPTDFVPESDGYFSHHTNKKVLLV